jgi:hypothetical protein
MYYSEERRVGSPRLESWLDVVCRFKSVDFADAAALRMTHPVCMY